MIVMFSKILDSESNGSVSSHSKRPGMTATIGLVVHAAGI